jgi:hypothetical protein
VPGNAPFRCALVTGFYASRLAGTLERWAEAEKLDFTQTVKLDSGGGGAFLFARGRSIRGAHVAQRRSGLRVRIELWLEPCASRGDWQMVFSLLMFLLERGARGTEEDGLPLVLGALGAQEAARRARFCFRREVLALRHARETRATAPSLVTPLFTLALGESDLGHGPLDDARLDALEARLVERARQQV